MSLELTKSRYHDVNGIFVFDRPLAPWRCHSRVRLLLIGFKKAEGGLVRFLHWYTNYLGLCLSIANLQISRMNSLVLWLHPRITNVSLADDETVFLSLNCLLRG